VIQQKYSFLHSQLGQQLRKSIEQVIGQELNLDLYTRKEQDDSVDCIQLNSPSSILQDHHQIKKLHKFLPTRYRIYNLELLFSTNKHGCSLATFYSKALGRSPTLLIIKDYQKFVFGYFSTEDWHQDNQFYGTGESFLWSLFPEFHVYTWTKTNDYFQYSDNSSLFMGGGTKKQEEMAEKDNENTHKGHYGLWIDKDMETGTTHVSDTYFNRTLASSEQFRIITLELWGFASK